MGIRQLQSFIQNSVTNGYLSVSLINECDQFKRENDCLPILVIDLNGIFRPLIKSKKEFLSGIRHNEVFKTADKLFEKLSKIAELIFFLDGPIIDVKVNEWIRRQSERYECSLSIYDKIKQGCNLEYVIETENNLLSFTTHSKIVQYLAIKYGTYKIAFDRECDAEMAQFAHNNPRVLAIMADDTDFLIYPGNWKCFSLRELNQDTLETMEYNRKALRQYLDLNDRELIILATLNGNDVINYNDAVHFHKSLIYEFKNPNLRFPVLAQFIKDNRLVQNRNLYPDIASMLYGSRSQRFVNNVKNSFDFYNINFQLEEITDELLKYLKEEDNNFPYSILKYSLKTFTLTYLDLNDFKNYSSAALNLFCKQIGIVLKSKPFRKYEVGIKLSHNDLFRTIQVDPIFPTQKLPPLDELLMRSKYPQHDNIRFDLVKWLINEEKLANVDLTAVPINLLLDILILVYMVTTGLIVPVEADIILLSIKHVITDTVPENVTMPDFLHPRAFIISHLFSKLNQAIRRCLSVTGLNGLAKLIDFDSVLFHVLFLKFAEQPFDVNLLLGDISTYRYYA